MDVRFEVSMFLTLSSSVCLVQTLQSYSWGSGRGNATTSTSPSHRQSRWLLSILSQRTGVRLQYVVFENSLMGPEYFPAVLALTSTMIQRDGAKPWCLPMAMGSPYGFDGGSCDVGDHHGPETYRPYETWRP